MNTVRSSHGTIIWGCIAVILVAGTSAEAAFIGGVEHFTGTTKDTATWQECTQGSPIVQNDQVDLFGQADYTTNTQTVGVGDWVSVKVNLAPEQSQPYPGTTGYVSLWLTNNSAGASGATATDSASVYVEFDTTGGCVWWGYHLSGAGSGGLIGTEPDPAGKWLTLKIERLTSTSAVVSAYDTAGDPIGSATRSFPAGIPDDLYVSLSTNWASAASFDQVTVFPEPATLGMLGLGGLGVLLRRKRR